MPHLWKSKINLALWNFDTIKHEMNDEFGHSLAWNFVFWEPILRQLRSRDHQSVSEDFFLRLFASAPLSRSHRVTDAKTERVVSVNIQRDSTHNSPDSKPIYSFPVQTSWKVRLIVNGSSEILPFFLFSTFLFLLRIRMFHLVFFFFSFVCSRCFSCPHVFFCLPE